MTRDFQVRRNLSAFPRAWVVHDARPIAPLDRAGASSTNTDTRAAIVRGLLFQNDPIWSDPDRPVLDLTRTALVETTSPGSLARFVSASTGAPTFRSTVRVAQFEPQRVALACELARPGIVVLAERHAPGWSLSIDGAPAEILRTNLLMRGAAVPAGPHILVYTYAPASLRIGAVASLIGWLGLLSVALWSRRQPSGSASPDFGP